MEFNARPLKIGGRIFSHIHHHIINGTTHTGNKFILSIRVQLIVKATKGFPVVIVAVVSILRAERNARRIKNRLFPENFKTTSDILKYGHINMSASKNR